LEAMHILAAATGSHGDSMADFENTSVDYRRGASPAAARGMLFVGLKSDCIALSIREPYRVFDER